MVGVAGKGAEGHTRKGDGGEDAVAWTASELSILRQTIRDNGLDDWRTVGDWSQVAAAVGGGKTAEQCFNRWHAEYREHTALELHQQQPQGYSSPPGADTSLRYRLHSGAAGKRVEQTPEISVFVGGLSPEVTDADLKQTFENKPYSSVLGAKVITDSVTGASRSFGFVRFGDEREGDDALTSMNGAECCGRRIRVLPATKLPSRQGQTEAHVTDPSNTTVLVVPVNHSVNEKILRDTFSCAGEIHTVTTPPGSGCASVTFAHRASAEHAINNMQGTYVCGGLVRLLWGNSGRADRQRRRERAGEVLGASMGGNSMQSSPTAAAAAAAARGAQYSYLYGSPQLSLLHNDGAYPINMFPPGAVYGGAFPQPWQQQQTGMPSPATTAAGQLLLQQHQQTYGVTYSPVRGGMDARKHGARWGGAAEPAVGGGRAIGGEGDGRRAASVGDCGDRKCGVDGGSVGSTTPGSCSKPHGGWPVMDAMDAGGSQDHPSPDLGEPGPAGEHEHPFVTRAERGLVAAAATFAERIAERGVTPRSEVLLRRQGSPSRLSPGGRPTSGEGQWLGKSIRSVQESGVVHHDLGVTGISTTPDQGPGADRPHSPVSTPSRACLEATESVRDEVLWALLGGGTVGVDDVAKSVLERARTTLITRFDSSPATYTAEDAGVRLHVRTGSMAERQEAGPIVIQTDERLLVECGGCSFLVSAVVDCQPSGSTFDVPLDLDFLVEEGQDEESDDSEDASPDGVFNQYKEIIQNTYKVLQRQESGDPWNILRDEEVDVVREDDIFFMRAKFNHFTEGCLAKNVQLYNAVQTETVKIGRPRKKQLEFINATSKTLTFLVLPTTWSNKAITSLAVSVGVKEVIEAKASIERAIEQAVLTEAMEPQVLQIPPMNRQGNPKGGERCTWDMCDMPESGGSDAKVALVTVEKTIVSVWFSRIFKERTRLMVLPGQFSAGMSPQLGKHPLPQGSRCLVSNTFMATGGEPMTVANAPVSTISSNGSTSMEDNMDEGDR